MGQGSFAYAESSDNRLPWFNLHRPPGQEWWITQVGRSMDAFEPEIHRCPSDPVLNYLDIFIYNGVAYMGDRARPRSIPTRTVSRLHKIRMQVSYLGSVTRALRPFW